MNVLREAVRFNVGIATFEFEGLASSFSFVNGQQVASLVTNQFGTGFNARDASYFSGGDIAEMNCTSVLGVGANVQIFAINGGSTGESCLFNVGNLLGTPAILGEAPQLDFYRNAVGIPQEEMFKLAEASNVDDTAMLVDCNLAGIHTLKRVVRDPVTGVLSAP